MKKFKLKRKHIGMACFINDTPYVVSAIVTVGSTIGFHLESLMSGSDAIVDKYGVCSSTSDQCSWYIDRLG